MRAGPGVDTRMDHAALSSSPPNRFGAIDLPPALKSFRHALSLEMIALLRSLPRSTHMAAVVFLMQHLGTAFLPRFDYFRHYHAPSWSILYWLAQRENRRPLAADHWRDARTAHAMALFLHPLDDHLNDGQLPATHLNLLLRSQAWRRMHTALESLAGRVADGAAVVRDLVDDYYASIASPPDRPTLEGYCHHFRKQMATWQIVPVLLARWQSPDADFADALQQAFGAFGIAWRLLDDLQDIEPDRRHGNRSAVFYSLPEHLRPVWRRAESVVNAPPNDGVDDHLARASIPAALRRRIRRELASAAAALRVHGMDGLAGELDAMAQPFQQGAAR